MNLTGEPYLVFEDGDYLVPHDFNWNVKESDLTVDIANSRMFYPRPTNCPFLKDDSEVVFDAYSIHADITADTLRVLGGAMDKISGIQHKEKPLDFVKFLRYSCQSDAIGVRQKKFRTKPHLQKTSFNLLDEDDMKMIEEDIAAADEHAAQQYATVLYTPYFPEDVTKGLHTRVYLLKQDLERYPTADISWLVK